ncbi:MAG: hypothetical protein QUT30_18985 [Acidobacteriota bacterium]|nr:hypothetical protein [Acidobacteriota bacterium]
MPADISWKTKLAACAVLAPSADNSQTWSLRWDGEKLSLTFHQRNHHSVFSAESHATLLSIGSSIELLNAALLANKVASELGWPQNPALGQPYVSILLKDNPTDFTIPEAVIQRHTNRFAYRSDPLPSLLLSETGRLQDGGCRIVSITDREKKSGLIQAVRVCSEARFCTRELVEWLTDSLRFTQEEVARGDGLDVRTLNLPPGGKLFMRFISDWRRMKILNYLGIYKIMALADTSLLPVAPALMCIVGPGDTKGSLDAGRLMTRLWMHLNMNGIAVHPYYVVTDQINRLHEGKVVAGFESRIGEVEQKLKNLLELQNGEMLHIIFRVGYPTKQPVRSRRLPLDAVFVDNS